MRKLKVFTLIELLVVIAIIAILASILLPALGRAKDSAEKIVCLNLFKQHGYVLHVYAGDWDSKAPGRYKGEWAGWDSSSGDTFCLWTAIYDYYGCKWEDYEKYMCPAGIKFTKDRGDTFSGAINDYNSRSSRFGIYKNSLSYGENNPGWKNIESPPSPHGDCIPLNLKMSVSSCFVIWDSDFSNRDPYGYDEANAIYYPHHRFGSSGVLFLDGHAKSYNHPNRVPSWGAEDWKYGYLS